MGNADADVAAVLLDSASTAQYLLARLVATDARWATVTNGVLIRLGRRYGARTVLAALGFLREEERDDTRTPVALLTSVCKRIEGDQ